MDDPRIERRGQLDGGGIDGRGIKCGWVGGLVILQSTFCVVLHSHTLLVTFVFSKFSRQFRLQKWSIECIHALCILYHERLSQAGIIVLAHSNGFACMQIITFFKQYVPLAYIVCLLDGDYWSGSWGHTTCRRLLVGAFFNSPIVSPELTVFAFFFKMGIEWVWINDQSSATRFQYRHEIKCEVRFASKVNLMDALLVFRRGKHLNWWVGRVAEIW